VSRWLLVLTAVGVLVATALPRNEISLQFGGTLIQRRTIAVPSELQNLLGTTALREDNGYAGGFSYRLRVAGHGSVDALLEIPLFVVQATNTDLLPVLVRPFFGNTSGASGYLTPGGVVRFASRARVSPYLFAGVGYARVVEAELASTSPLRGKLANVGTWAVDFGAGADLRIYRFLGIRGELRNFYTGHTQDENLPVPGETRQRNTLLLTGGLSFRF
jgi:hypothetical protein